MHQRLWRRFLQVASDASCARDDLGATATEYALMAGFIAAVIVTGVTALGMQVVALFGMGVASFP